MVDFIKEEIFVDTHMEDHSCELIGESNSLIPEKSYNASEENYDSLINENADKQSNISVTGRSSDQTETMLEENFSALTSVTEKPLVEPKKTKIPKKKSHQKLFYASQRRRRKQKLQIKMASLSPQVIVKEEPFQIGSVSFDPDRMETVEGQNKETSAEDTLNHTSVTMAKLEPNSPSADTPILDPTLQNPTVRLQRVLLQRCREEKPGMAVYTPPQASENPILTNPILRPDEVNAVFRKTVEKLIITPGGQRKLVTVWPDGNGSKGTVAADGTESEINTTSHCEYISPTSEAAQARSSPVITLVSEPGKPPKFTLVNRPKDVPTFSQVPQPGASQKFSPVPQSGNIPKASFVAQPRNCPRVSFAAKPGVLPVPKPGSTPRFAFVPTRLNRPVVPRVPQPGNIQAAASVGNVSAGSPMPGPGNIPQVSQATLGNAPTSSQIPITAHANFVNGLITPFTGLVAEQQPRVRTPAEQLIEEVGRKLIETTPAPWITILRPTGVALCLLSSTTIVTIRRSILFENTGKVIVGVHGKELPQEHPYSTFVKENTVELREDTIEEFLANINRLFLRLRSMEVCRAVEEYQQFWKNTENVEIDDNRFQELRFAECCRAKNCLLLVPSLSYKRCVECTKVCRNMSKRSAVASKKPETLSIHKPFKYLTSPEKRERFNKVVRDSRLLRLMNRRLNAKLNLLLNPDEGVPSKSGADDDAEMAEDNSERGALHKDQDFNQSLHARKNSQRPFQAGALETDFNRSFHGEYQSAPLDDSRRQFGYENMEYRTVIQGHPHPGSAVMIISYIFSFLSYSDRKESRRVCHRWYRASLDPKLVNQEMVTCPRNSCGRFSTAMMESKKVIFHLTIKEDSTLWYVDEFWDRFGPKLRSLAIFHCRGSGRRLFRILRRCPKLQSFEVFRTLLLFRPDEQISGCENKKFRTILPNLKCLQTLKISSSRESNAILFDKLIACAPNLQTLTLDRCLEPLIIRSVHGVWVVGRIKGLTCKHIVSYLRRNVHRTFDLGLTYSKVDDYKGFLDIITVPNVRLRKLKTDSPEAIFSSRSEKWLQELELENIYVNDSTLESICNFQELQRLSLADRDIKLSVSYSVQQLSLLRNLTHLSMRKCEVNDTDFVAGLCSEVNTTLKELTLIDLRLVTQVCIVELARTHPSLVHLTLSGCKGLTDWSVQAIFKYMLSLESLKFSRCKNLTDAGLSGLKISYWNSTQWWINRPRFARMNPEEKMNLTGYSIARLQNLKAITINECKGVHGNFFKTGVSFPNIRLLILGNVKMSTKAFRCLFENNTTIEVLELRKCKVPDKLLNVIATKMKRLKHIKLSVRPRSVDLLRPSVPPENEEVYFQDRPAFSFEGIKFLQQLNINVSYSSVIPVKVPSFILRDPPRDRDLLQIDNDLVL